MYRMRHITDEVYLHFSISQELYLLLSSSDSDPGLLWILRFWNYFSSVLMICILPQSRLFSIITLNIRDENFTEPIPEDLTAATVLLIPASALPLYIWVEFELLLDQDFVSVFFAYSGCSTMLWSRFKCDKPYVRGCKYSNNAGNSLPDSVERKTSFFCRRCIVIFYSKHQVPHAPGEHSGRQSPQPALQEDPDPAGSSWHRPRQCHPAHG